MSYGYIYLIKDSFTKKIYVGRHKGHESESLNYFGGGTIIRNIVKKRKHHLSKIILGYCETLQELKNAETECIYFYRAFGSDGIHYDEIYGYNLKPSGEDGGPIRFGPHSEESKQKMRKPRSKQTKQNMKIAQNKNIILKQITSKKLWADSAYRSKQTKALQKSWDDNSKRKTHFSKIFSGKGNPASIQIDTKEIIRLYNEGFSMRKLSVMFNCTHPTISKRIKYPEKYL